MATKVSASPQGGCSVQSELRIVILGKTGEDKNIVVKSVLNRENLTREKDACTLYKSEQAGRKISVVEAPGWEKHSIQEMSENIKEEIVRSVSLCPPGPHALLLVIPVKTLSDKPSTEIKAAHAHMKLLSERVWKHTIVLFACDEGVKETAIRKHIHSAEKILDKCGGRSHVLQRSACESPTQISELFQKIDNLVEENRGEFFIPQVYYELIQQKTQEVSGSTELRQRRGSLQMNPPSYKSDKGDPEKKETIETAKHTPLEDMPKITMDFKQLVVILMGVFGALIGAVAGAENGVSGSCSGIVFGIIVGVLLASFIMYIYTRIYSRAYSKQPAQSAS